MRVFDASRRKELIADLHERPRTLVFVQTKHLAELLDDLPASLEFVRRNRDGIVTIGEVRRRREVNDAPLAASR